MVNFLPEDNSGPNGKLTTSSEHAVCYVKAASAQKPTGILDAHSKHFLLAQDILAAPGSSRLASLSDYSKATSAKWVDATVDYAGEIIVNLTNCSYTINNGSGTYRPYAGRNGDFVYILQVAQLFAATVGFAPDEVWDSTPGLSIPTIRVPRSGTPIRGI